jgi:hypothetical protein
MGLDNPASDRHNEDGADKKDLIAVSSSGRCAAHDYLLSSDLST